MEKPECFEECPFCTCIDTHCIVDYYYAKKHVECFSCNFYVDNVNYVDDVDTDEGE